MGRTKYNLGGGWPRDRTVDRRTSVGAEPCSRRMFLIHTLLSSFFSEAFFRRMCVVPHCVVSHSLTSFLKFLFYQEKYTKAEGSSILTKQTYSAWVDLPTGPKKWHLSKWLLHRSVPQDVSNSPLVNSAPSSAAYFTQATLGNMRTVDEIPCMQNVSIPPGMYRRSRTGKRKSDNRRPSLVDLPSPISEPGSPRQEHGTYPLYIPFDGHARSSPCPRRLSDSSGSDAQEDDFYHWKRPRERAACAFPVQDQTDPVAGELAPLAYLQSLQNPRRSPADEVALRALPSFN
jgi:hypothetical protein